MARLKNTVSGLAKPILTLAIGVAVVCMPQGAEAADIPVESEADYQLMLDAIRAAEYVRQNYLEDQPNPRAIAGVAGLWAYAEANPLATPDQFGAFIASYDAALAVSIPGDDRLAKTGSVLTALISTRIDSAGALAGTDTRAGLEGLPTYEQFLEIRDVEGAHLGLEDEVFARIDEVQLDSMQTLDAIGIAEVQPNLALDSLALFTAANDTDDPNHAAALAQLEARRQAVIDSIRDTSDDRAAIFARTLILQQSNYP